MQYAPVAIFVYNRADHFAQTYTALAACVEAKETDLYIFADNAKNDAAIPGVEAVRRLARDYAERRDFRTVQVILREKNYGLAKSIVSGVTEVIRKYGKIIVLEDDCVSSPYLLSYMNRCLERYVLDHSIGSIAGYSPSLCFPQDYGRDIFLSSRTCSMTWATWVDRWENVDWTRDGMLPFLGSTDLRRRLTAEGPERFWRLYRQLRGRANSWSVCFGAHHAKENLLVIYPRYSYIQNIGCDASGEHSKSGDEAKIQVDITRAISNPNCEKPPLDGRIQKEMRDFYSAGKVSDIKHGLAGVAVGLLYRLGCIK